MHAAPVPFADDARLGDIATGGPPNQTWLIIIDTRGIEADTWDTVSLKMTSEF